MRSEKVSEPAQIECVPGIVFASKKDGSLPFCVDYRKSNAVTVIDAYSLPRLDECLDYSENVAVFSSPDAHGHYWRSEVQEANRDKTAFIFHNGLYEF